MNVTETVEEFEARLNEPPLNSPIKNLKHIGNRINRNFQAEGLYTLQDIVNFLIVRKEIHASWRQAKTDITTFFNRVFENPKRGSCVPPQYMDRRYSVREQNKYGWNALMIYLRKKAANPDLGLDRRIIPNRYPHSKNLQVDYPERCRI